MDIIKVTSEPYIIELVIYIWKWYKKRFSKTNYDIQLLCSGFPYLTIYDFYFISIIVNTIEEEWSVSKSVIKVIGRPLNVSDFTVCQK